jgi:hypothetical protein
LNEQGSHLELAWNYFQTVFLKKLIFLFDFFIFFIVLICSK